MVSLIWKRWSATWREWTECTWRRSLNEAGTSSDSLGWRTASFWLAAFLGHRTWLQEGLPGLALACATHSLLALCLGWLASSRRGWYIRHREVLHAIAILQVVWVSHMLGFFGGTNLFHQAGTSALLLFFATVVCNGSIFICLYTLFARLDMRWNRFALPLLALPPLVLTKRLCGRVLEAPAAPTPLADLYTALIAAHSAAVFPLASLSSPSAKNPADPLQQCTAVSAWSVLLFAVAVPLLVLYRLEYRQRKLAAQREQQWEQHWQQRGEEEEVAPPAGVGAAASAARRAGLRRRRHALCAVQPVPFWFMELYLSSCFLWAVVGLLQPILT